MIYYWEALRLRVRVRLLAMICYQEALRVRVRVRVLARLRVAISVFVDVPCSVTDPCG